MRVLRMHSPSHYVKKKQIILYSMRAPKLGLFSKTESRRLSLISNEFIFYIYIYIYTATRMCVNLFVIHSISYNNGNETNVLSFY